MLNILTKRVSLGVDSLKFGFTLAEVLITLAIIGIVSALTMPVLIQKHQKNIVITRMKKFYTNINQAIKLSEIENGDLKYWEYPSEDNSVEATKIFYDKYLAKYLKAVKIGEVSVEGVDNEGNPAGYTDNFLTVYLSDGSVFNMRGTRGIDIVFFPEAKNIKYGVTHRTGFTFNFNKIDSVGVKSYVEPYTFQWDGTREGLKNHVRYGCNKNHVNFCAKLIQYDGWQIKEDYPW